jgi:hypothetical protein
VVIGVVIDVMPRHPPSPMTTRPSSSWATVWRATMTSLRLPGQHWPATTTRRRSALMMIWVLTLRRQFLLVAVIAWSCAGIRVPSTMHGWLLLLGVSISASGGTRWQMMRSAVDWLVPNGAAGARVVRLGAPAATTRWPLLNKQHSAHPRTDQAKNLDVAGPAENNQPPS